MTASRRPGRREVIILDRKALRRKALHRKPLCTRRRKPIMAATSIGHYKESFLFVDVTLSLPFQAVNTNGG
jgi:hypothetical protein